VKRHKANFHEMDVVYYPCNVNGSSFEAKRVDSLTGYTILLIDGRDFVIFDLSFESFVIRDKIDCIGVVIDI